jgi:YHS domain-containing protein
MIRFAMTLLAAASLAGIAGAGEQYVDETAFAVSGYDPVAYFDLPQSPVGQPQPPAVPGKADITAEYNGAIFAFSSETNRDRFLSDPARFAPQYDGHCAFGVTKGGKAPGNPMLWRIVDDRLYLNVTRNVVGFWEADIAGNIDRAESNWASIEPTESAKRAIPDFQSSAPHY